MKNILKTIALSIFFTGIVSCEYDKDPVAVANGLELRKDASVVSPTILLQDNDAENFAKFVWDAADNGPATVSAYKLQIFDHADANLENPVEFTGDLNITPDSREVTLTVQQFNNLLNQLNTFKCSEMDVDVRIKSTLGGNAGNALIQYSNPINLKVTGYTKKLPIMAFVLDGSNAVNAPTIAASSTSSDSDYEGYMYLEAGNYKFHRPDACGDFASPVIYGGSAGNIDTSASPVSVQVTTAGHYLLKVNLTANTYTLNQFTTFGVFGAATRSGLGFGNQVPFEYNAETKIWSLEIALRKGYKFKFKSNLWTGALVVPALPNPPYAPGTASSAVSILGKGAVALSLVENSTTGSGDITVPGTIDETRETYKIELDVSKPRNYTYTMTKI